jgi:hypothetical protein
MQAKVAMAFENGPPDTTALSTAQRIEVMRDYRRWKEQPQPVDFAAGVPDVSALPRSEQLQVLREYRTWCDAQAKPASPPPQTAAGARPGTASIRHEQAVASPTSGATYEQQEFEGAAGVTSSQREVPANYFERPITARAPAVTPAWAAEPEPPTAPPTARVWDATGSAGMRTTERPPSQHGWIEQTSSHYETSSRPGTAREVRTEQRIFAPLPSADGAGPAGSRARYEAQRDARHRRLDEVAAETHRNFDAGGDFVAGSATPLNDASARDLMTLAPPAAGNYPRPRPPGTPRQGDARAQSYLQGYDGDPRYDAPELNRPATGSAAAAGMGSTHDKPVSARGMVAIPDERHTANYNLQFKQLATAQGAPYLGGGERYQGQMERAVVDTNRSEQVGRILEPISFYEAGRARPA